MRIFNLLVVACLLLWGTFGHGFETIANALERFDRCSNVADIQFSIPEGMLQNDDGSCTVSIGQVPGRDIGFIKGTWNTSTNEAEWLVIYGGTDNQGDCSLRYWRPNTTAKIDGAGFQAYLFMASSLEEALPFIDGFRKKAEQETGQTCEIR